MHREPALVQKWRSSCKGMFGQGYFIGCLILKVGCYAVPILIFVFLCSKRPQDRKALNSEEHVFETTLAMRQKEQAHFDFQVQIMKISPYYDATMATCISSS